MCRNISYFSCSSCLCDFIVWKSESFNGFSPCIFSMCRAFVFFSSPISKELVGHIKKDATVLTRIAALREVAFLFHGNFLFLD